MRAPSLAQSAARRATRGATTRSMPGATRVATLRGATRRAVGPALALAFAALFPLAAQQAAQQPAATPPQSTAQNGSTQAPGSQSAGAASSSDSSSDDSLFGAETVTPAATNTTTSVSTKEFLKYDATLVGGNVSGSLGWSATWADPFSGSADFSSPTVNTMSPYLQGAVKITAKPSEDFGVNMEFRTNNPFDLSQSSTSSSSTGVASSLSSLGGTYAETTNIPNITVWSLYSKFSWNDTLYFSFGKQPLAWGVSKSFFQPADDIFATTAVDYTNTSGEREGPIAFKAQYGIPRTMTNFYFFAGLPDKTNPVLGDMRYAAKAETNLGNTELAAGAYYSYNDHPRALLMGTTGFGNLNFFGEAVGKWGSERYFLSSTTPQPPAFLGVTGAQKPDQVWFTGTVGGYYIDGDNNITITAAYFYNGEGQTGVNAQNYFDYIMQNPGQYDRMYFGTHYAAASFSKDKLLVDELSFSIYGIGDLSDRSFLIAPSITWKFFDYLSIALGSTLALGPDGSEYPTLLSTTFVASNPSLMGKPSASISLTATLGTGAF